MLQTHVESKNGLQSFAEASPEHELAPVGIATIQEQMKKMADFGRNGDLYVVHAAEGETVIPLEVLDANPEMKKLLFNQMKEMGLDPERYIVGSELNSINPVTGAPEFFFSKIFKSVKKRLKKAVKSLRGTGFFTTVLPLAGQYIGVPGGPAFLRPGTLGSNLVYSLLGQKLEQGRDFNLKDTAKGLALNAAKGIAFNAAQNMYAGKDTFSGIGSYLTGEGLPSTYEKFFGEKPGAELSVGDSREKRDDARSASALEVARTLQDRTYADQSGYGPIVRKRIDTTPSKLIPTGGDKSVAELNSMKIQPELTSLRASVERSDDPTVLQAKEGRSSSFSEDAVDIHNKRVAASSYRPNTATRASVREDGGENPLSSLKLSPEELKDLERQKRNYDISQYLYGDDAELRRNYVDAREAAYEKENKKGLLGLGKGPLGLPSIGGHITENEGLARLADIGIYGYGAYKALDMAGAFDEEPEEDVDRDDLEGFVPQKTGVDLLAENREKYTLPEESLDPYRFVERKPEALVRDGGMVQKMAAGGYPRRQLLVEGPGTATSDSIPAMLSDGEFVMTEQAVRGADPSGNGDRYAGANNLYNMMRNFEMNSVV